MAPECRCSRVSTASLRESRAPEVRVVKLLRSIAVGAVSIAQMLESLLWKHKTAQALRDYCRGLRNYS